MKHREARAELQGAVYRGDVGSLVGILKREVWPEKALQLIGDGLLRVLHAPTEGIDEAAHRCVTALWDRDWEGDTDLAAGLEAAPLWLRVPRSFPRLPLCALVTVRVRGYSRSSWRASRCRFARATRSSSERSSPGKSRACVFALRASKSSCDSHHSTMPRAVSRRGHSGCSGSVIKDDNRALCQANFCK
jgi:hypothetical protein